jgi:hypothetical protein
VLGKKTLLFIFLLFSFSIYAQPYGNEWINYNQKYYKFPVTVDGIYRIDSTALANAGIAVNTIDPRTLQIFGRGEELYIYVAGEADGVMNTSDYVEFYAQRNDGFLDSLVYNGATNQPNPYYSLYNDTAFYFLTWNSSTTNNRSAVIADNTFNQYTPVNYFFKEDVLYKPNYYYDGPSNSKNDDSPDPEYDKAEGWFDSPFYMGGSALFSLSTPNIYSVGPNTTINTAIIGASNDYDILNDHQLRIEYKNSVGNYTTITDSTFEGYTYLKFNYSIPSSQFSTSTDIKYSSIYNASFINNNRTAVCYANIKYPHTLDLEGKDSYLMHVPENVLQTKSFLSISNFNAAVAILYDLTNNKRIEVIPSGANFNVLIPNSGKEKKCFITDESKIIQVSSLTPVSPDGFFINFSNSLADSLFIMVTHNKLMTEATNYMVYRKSISGGSRNCILADIDQLYDQFAFGIHQHPYAIRRFADFLIGNAPTPPKDLFLIGKSIKIKYCRNAAGDASYLSNYASCLVPSFGDPTCDNLLTAKLNGTYLESAIPTGRLSVKNTSEIVAYLAKVSAYENQSAAAWMKQVIHFGGGSTASEQNVFKGYLNNYEKIIKDSLFGGNVYTVLKTSSAPISTNLSDYVKSKINSGVSIITFFGHAAGNSFDQSIDQASSYNNTDKYPLIIANSCYAGDIHQPYSVQYSNVSEDFILTPEKGAIGFLSNVNLGIPYALNLYTNALYKNIAYKNYNKSIGSCIQATVVDNQGNASNLAIKDVLLQMTLHGDPAIKINAHQLPDYDVTDNAVFFSPSSVTTEMDSFNVSVVVSNLGRAINTPVVVELNRIFPDATNSLSNKTLKNVYYKDTVVFTLPVDKLKGAGFNKFEVRVDPINEQQELSELNNNIFSPPASLFISSGAIIPVYPYKYAIVANDSVVLSAATGNVFAPTQNYIFEIDTTDAFNTPFKRQQIVAQSGGVVNAAYESWSPSSFEYVDSTVYYWRVRKDDADMISYPWKESSFQYIAGKNGWGQSHFNQFKNNTYVFVQQNTQQRRYDFVTTGKKLTCNTYGQIPPNYIYSELYATQYKLDFLLQESAGCQVAPALMVAIIDPIQLESWGKHWIDNSYTVPIEYNPTHSFGNANDLGACRNSMEKYFIFRSQDATQMAGMKNMLENVVPEGHYILVYSWIKANFKSWADTSLYTTFENLGADSVRYLSDTIPYIFFAKKGDLNSAVEVIGKKANDAIELSIDLNNNASYGTIASELIGPATSWDSLSWRQHALESFTNDSVRLSIIGVSENGIETILKSDLPPDSANIYLKEVNASNYPSLRLNVYLADDSLQTVAQMDKWQVFYSPVPELAISPNLGYTMYKDSLQEGDSLRLSIAIQNVSEYSFADSLLIAYWLEDKSSNSLPVNYQYISLPLLGGAVYIDTIVMGTIGITGSNKLWVEVNPLNTNKTQQEQYHFNNIAIIDFNVIGDNINPLLDVTFDGQRILNGDIVSAKPDILIQLKDENKFLALNDTSDFTVFLKKPGNAIEQRIYFGSEMTFIPAVLPNNSCKINYKPVLTIDGTYQLTVQAKDKSDNVSGAIDYKIAFEIINKATITEVLNYPNPFTTSTRFVFTITGSQVPDYFKIQIMTITGKVVKEISKEDLGPLYVGKNITEYAWNGTDDFDDRLANGIYLYRVLTQLNGGDIERRETSADDFFKKGYGKMYLMR